jgi:hypothetical protein
MLVELVLIKKLLSNLTQTNGQAITPSAAASVVVPEVIQTASEFQERARQYLSGLK